MDELSCALYIKNFFNGNNVSILEDDIFPQGEVISEKGIECVYTGYEQSTFIIERGKKRLIVLWLMWTWDDAHANEMLKMGSVLWW